MNKSFIQIDIVDYYPSVSEELFEQTLKFADQFTQINNDDKNILRNARKSILFYKQQIWKNKLVFLILLWEHMMGLKLQTLWD